MNDISSMDPQPADHVAGAFDLDDEDIVLDEDDEDDGDESGDEDDRNAHDDPGDIDVEDGEPTLPRGHEVSDEAKS